MKNINIGIIAHVDVGKSTFVDALLHEHYFNGAQSTDQSIDKFDLEQERGITIYSKNCSIQYKNTKINIIDTPGHADFSSEVERVIKTVDTVLLLVDAVEGPMPQTRFVLEKALSHGLQPVVLINKIDKKEARSSEVLEEIYDLFIDLEANDNQFNFPVLYGTTRDRIFKKDLASDNEGITIVLDKLIERCRYQNNERMPVLYQAYSKEYNNHYGLLTIGRLYQGILEKNKSYFQKSLDGSTTTVKIKQLFTYDGLLYKPVQKVYAGDIALIAGVDTIELGDSLVEVADQEQLSRVKMDDPKISFILGVNGSSLSGLEGQYKTSTQIYERLSHETSINPGIKVEKTSNSNNFKVLTRGMLQFSVLVETMRREGYEFEVQRPSVEYRFVNEKKFEPIEKLECIIPIEYNSNVSHALEMRKAELENVEYYDTYLKQTWLIPSRSLVGLNDLILNLTKGKGTFSHHFYDYHLYKGDLLKRVNGSMISNEAGISMLYSMFHLKDRGDFFIPEKTVVYKGMIVGMCRRSNDIEVNVIKNKRLNSFRGNGSGGKEEALKIDPPIQADFEYLIAYINDDECIEITPLNIRARNRYY